MTFRPSSLQARLFLAFALVTALAVVLPVAFSRTNVYRERINLAQAQALSEVRFVRDLLEGADAAQVDRLFEAAKALSVRLTLVDGSGRVLRDTHASLPDLDNHGDRPEIEHALESGAAVSLRYSSSLKDEAIYAAARLSSGGSIRVAAPVAEIDRRLSSELALFTLAVLGAALLCLAVSWYIVRGVRRDIGSMTDVVRSISPRTPGRRLRTVPGREFLPLAAAVNRMADNAEKALRLTQDQSGQLETILDSLHEGVLVVDREGRVRRVNKTLAAMFPQAETAAGKPLIEAVPLPLLHLRTEAVLRGEDPNGALESEYPAGRHLIMHVSPPSIPGETLGAVIVVYDATDIMRLERVRKDFVANVSHELRTPLTAISGCAELLGECPDLGPEYLEFTAIIRRNAALLSRIVGDLLDLARIENSNEPIAREPLNPVFSLTNALHVCEPMAEAKHLHLDVSVPETLILANAGLLTQVFRNLLENACRYAPEHSTVRVSAEPRETVMLFTVSDQGPGIPPDSLDRIFERFYQVEKERNSASAGIGLAICRHVVERLGGRIWAESPYGDAATAMRFTLPLAVPARV